MLSEAICSYNYSQINEERKRKLYLLKERKYEKIKAIRFSHIHESYENERRRITMKKEIFDEKVKWKSLIYKDKDLAMEAMKKSLIEKKVIGEEIR